MNWQYKLIIIVAFSATIFSCKQNKENLELQPTNMVGAIFVDTFSVKAYTVQLDSTYSGNFNVGRHLVGVMDDPLLGKTISSAFGVLVLPEDGLSFISDSTQYVSIELHLPMDYHYGNNDNVTILVNKVEEDISSNDAFFVFDNAQLGENIGSFTISPSIGIDTQLVFPLSNSFGLSLYNQSSEGAFKNSENFISYLKGISLQAQNGNSIIGFGFDSTFVRINYMSGGTLIYKDFSFAEDHHFNRIITDRTNTLISTLTTDKSQVESSSLNNQTYVQGGTRLDTRLNFPSVESFFSKEGTSIYRAELEITANFITDLPKPTNLYLFSSNEGNFENYNSLLATNDLTNFVTLTGGKYTYDITNYMQRVASDLTDLDDFMLSLSPNSLFVDRLIIDNPQENIKLKIYYTEL